MNRLNNFQFKGWHFILTFIALSIVVNVIGAIKIKQIPVNIAESRFTAIDDNFICSNNNSAQISIILCYKESSDLCKKMEYNLNQLPENDNIKYYKLNLEKNSRDKIPYSISGVPSILILKEGKEIERIIGIVSVSNLDIIYKRILKQINN